MKFKLYSTVFMITALIFALPLSGCTINGRTAQRQMPGTTQQPGRNLVGGNLSVGTPFPTGKLLSTTPTVIPTPGVGQLIPSPRPLTLDGQTKAANIRTQLRKMPEIRQLESVVMGNTAIIGFTPSKASKDVNALRNTITNKVKQMDKSITRVVVTDSSATINKIKQLSRDMSINKPVHELSSSFNKLIQSINPAR